MPSPIDVLELERTTENTFRADSVELALGRPVFGGQFLGQLVMVAASVAPEKVLRTMQVVFPRPGDTAQPLVYTVEPVHSGRTMATLGVAVTQHGKQVCRATLLLDTEDEDVMRHQAAAPDAGRPENGTPVEELESHGAQVRVAGDVDLSPGHVAGPPEYLAWVRWPDAPRADRVRSAAIAAWYTDSLLIGAAMRPHPHIDETMAHTTLSTGVVSHTLTFHGAIEAADWHLLANESTHAGNGRVYGQGRVFTADGNLVASFVQDGMVRRFPEHVTGHGSGVL